MHQGGDTGTSILLRRAVICSSPRSAGEYAAATAAARINHILSESDRVRVLLSTGESQFETLRSLVRRPVDWSRVEVFHLDEYIGLPADHPASFRRYLRERVADLIPVTLHEVDPSSPDRLKALSELAGAAPMDVALVGIGENGHIAFNDPPADLEAPGPYIEVELAERCRRQQVREGWFATIGDVPDRAITMSVSAIMRSRTIISAVPHGAKAPIMRQMLTSAEVTADLPASVLAEHPDVTLVLDRASGQYLPGKVWNRCIVL